MTTTPQVDLAEARNIAGRFTTPLSLSMVGNSAYAVANTIRALADEVEALQEIEAFQRVDLEDCQAQRDAAFRTIEQLQDELAALKAVGPDGLPPLPTPRGIGGMYFPDQMNAHYRLGYQHGSAAIAAQQPKEVTVDIVRSVGGIIHSDGNVFFTSIDQLNRAVLALAQKGGE